MDSASANDKVCKFSSVQLTLDQQGNNRKTNAGNGTEEEKKKECLVMHSLYYRTEYKVLYFPILKDAVLEYRIQKQSRHFIYKHNVIFSH